MTSTTDRLSQSDSSRRAPKSRRPVRPLALTLAVAAATTAGLVVGLGPSVAQADPGDTFLPIGSSQLVQSEDLVSIQVPLDTETVSLNRNDPFSACLGEGSRWTDVLPGAAKPITAAWTRRGHDDQALFESIGQAKTAAQAKRYADILLKVGVRNCQGTKAPYDFHYGATQSSSVGSGTATWALSYRGKQTRPDGGVVVFRKGTNVGIVEVNGTFGNADQTMESVAKVAVDRLR